MKKRVYLAALLAAFSLTTVSGFTACSKKGPAEKAGEKLDNAGDKVKDALTPEGPAEKAGKKVDKAVDNLKR